MHPNDEKPWYLPVLIAFLREDIPSVVDYTPTEAARDIATLERRCCHEGESFLTKTLPALGKLFDLALQETSPLNLGGFLKRKSPKSTLPQFLGALFKRVFLDDGTIRNEPCIKTIAVLRQLFFWCKKVEKGFTDESLRQASAEFIQTDAELPTSGTLPRIGVLETAKALISLLFRNHPKLEVLRPKHGPGAVATGACPVKKRRNRRCYTRLERVFRPYHFFFSLGELSVDYERLTGRIQSEYGLSRTTFVEKDSSGPRTIGLEPAEYMWCQQAIKTYMYNHIEKHPLTRGRVNFTDQSVNQKLTADWSSYDTLDMSKASDRNSLALVEKLFGNTWLLRYLLACRTPGTVLPDGQILWFKKFAPMGSAVCFPVEAVVFYAMACASLHRQGVPLLIATRKVRVYGDDLIVPHGFYEGLVADFEAVGLKFNDGKSCRSGKFRESCGVDAYDGVNVTPVRMKKIHPGNDAPSYIPLIRHQNNLMSRGYWAAASCLKKTALDLFSVLKGMYIPSSFWHDLPIAAWRAMPSESEQVSIIYRDYVPGVRGLKYSATKVESKWQCEETYYQESLSLGGPVGALPSMLPPKKFGDWRRKRREKRFRTFEKPYSGSLSYARFTPYTPIDSRDAKVVAGTIAPIWTVRKDSSHETLK